MAPKEGALEEASPSFLGTQPGYISILFLLVPKEPLPC